MIVALLQLDTSDGFGPGSHKDSSRFEVNTVRTERLCFASPVGDHAIAATILEDCSSPIDNTSRLAGSWSGHSLNEKRLASM